MTSLSVEVKGINEAIRTLNKIEPGLRKAYNNEARNIAAPAVNAVKNAYKFVPLTPKPQNPDRSLIRLIILMLDRK